MVLTKMQQPLNVNGTKLLLDRAIARLRLLDEQARGDGLYGTVSVEIIYQNGKAERVRHHVDATEK